MGDPRTIHQILHIVAKDLALSCLYVSIQSSPYNVQAILSGLLSSHNGSGGYSLRNCSCTGCTRRQGCYRLTFLVVGYNTHCNHIEEFVVKLRGEDGHWYGATECVDCERTTVCALFDPLP